MAFTRIENKTPDVSIPYVSYPNKSVYIHGSTYTRDWRTNLIANLSDKDVLLLDPWRNSWSNYKTAMESELEDFQNLNSQGISSGTGGVGTGIVDGYSPMVIPDIENTPYFWENRNSEACDFKFFCFDSDKEIVRHVALQMAAAVKATPNKVVVHIVKEDWRINYSVFLKNLPRENYFSNFSNAVARLNILMGI